MGFFKDIYQKVIFLILRKNFLDQTHIQIYAAVGFY